jgi:putative DNA primase/helicase
MRDNAANQQRNRRESDNQRTPTTIAECAQIPRWVAWRMEEDEGSDGEINKKKVPVDPATGRRARTNDPMTFGTRAEADRRWRLMTTAHDGGGIGFVLGHISSRHVLFGIDLDSCIDPRTGKIAAWAREIIDRFDSYAEISPSGEGAKVFFLMRAADADAVKQLLGTGEAGKQLTRKTFSVGEHRELALDTARFYTITEWRLEDAPMDFNVIPVEEIKWLFEEAGPAYQRLHGKSEGSSGTVGREGRDESNSGYGFRLFQKCQLMGDTFEQAVEKLRADAGPAGDWARYAPNREIKRTWENSKLGTGNIHSWDEPDLSLLDDRRGDLPEFPLDTLEPEKLRDWVNQAAEGAGTSIGHVAVPLIGVASGLIGTVRKALTRRVNAEESQKIIDRLVQAGWLKEAETEPHRGRPPRRWNVNERLFAQGGG